MNVSRIPPENRGLEKFRRSEVLLALVRRRIVGPTNSSEALDERPVASSRWEEWSPVRGRSRFAGA